jgi:hypothetical protein
MKLGLYEGSFNGILPLKFYICPEQIIVESKTILFTTDLNVSQHTYKC